MREPCTVANDGMMHALSPSNGQELWAYAPGFALANAGASSQKSWAFQTLLDTTPTLGWAGGRARVLCAGCQQPQGRPGRCQ